MASSEVPPQETALRRIATCRQRRIDLDDAEIVAVATARHLGARWWQIAEAVEMEQPAAARKFGKLIAERDPLPHTTSRAEALAEVKRIQRQRAEAVEAEVDAVANARAAEVTWQRIADTLGVRQSSAVQRFRPLIEGTPTVAEQRRGGSEPAHPRRRTTSVYGRRS